MHPKGLICVKKKIELKKFWINFLKIINLIYEENNY
jgi:hypothetical protein